MIISIEGIDGAGKNTITQAIKEHLPHVHTLSFPQYDTSIHAQLASSALYGNMGDITDSAYAMATLFALDRHSAKEQLTRYKYSADILLIDRYTASNAAYSWARTSDKELVAWVEKLEFNTLSIPKPDLQILLDTDPTTAQDRAQKRANTNSTRQLDVYEKDHTLQERTYNAYRHLADTSWISPWIIHHDKNTIINKINMFIDSR